MIVLNLSTIMLYYYLNNYYHINRHKAFCQYGLKGEMTMRSFTTFDLQYAHRFYGFKGEAQYLHGHTGILTLEVEDSINPGVNMVFPCNEINLNP